MEFNKLNLKTHPEQSVQEDSKGDRGELPIASKTHTESSNSEEQDWEDRRPDPLSRNRHLNHTRNLAFQVSERKNRLVSNCLFIFAGGEAAKT